MYQRDIAHIIVQTLKRTTGKGPNLVKVNISENVIIIDIKGALTTLEHTLIKKSCQNVLLVKVIRKKIINAELANITAEFKQLTHMPDLQIKCFTSEIDYENDRQIILFICNKFLLEYSY
ncbi:MAG TPA: hypothetical protein DDW65_12450 [Firmicutes bacterium]|jgi:uncharacterized protein YbcI|nr:hypothetical protein [Bacillota bacterium]